jgi:hypothetical protein
VIFRLSSLVDLELQFYAFALACFVGKLWWIGPLCSISSLGVPSALCGARPVITGHSVSSLSLQLVCASCLLCCFCVSTLVVPSKSCLQAFRLHFIPSGCSAVMRVKVDFLDVPIASAALSLGDLTFIIEEPRPSFFTPACKHKDSPLSVCWERWKHIQCFHFVYASPDLICPWL